MRTSSRTRSPRHSASGSTPRRRTRSGRWRRSSRSRHKRIAARRGSYRALALGGPLDGGIVECGATRATWLPYVEVEEIEAITERARRLGASVLLEPREGPAGWRNVPTTSEGGEIALWQPERRLGRGRE